MELLLFLALSYTLILIVVLVDRFFDLGIWKEVARSSVLSLLQLLAIAAILIFLLKLHSKLLTLNLALLMAFNASLIAINRFKFRSYSRKKILLLIYFSIVSVTSLLIIPMFLVGFVNFSPTKFIPMCGIIIAAGMRSLTLSLSIYTSKLRDLEEVIVSMLALGARDVDVSRFILKDVLRDATVPVRDMLKAAGIVHIPGIMVGLLMAGVFPLRAAVIQFTVLSSILFEYLLVASLFMFLWVKFFGLKLDFGGKANGA